MAQSLVEPVGSIIDAVNAALEQTVAFFGRFRAESYVRRPFCRRCITAQDDLDAIIAAVADIMQRKLYSLQVHRHYSPVGELGDNVVDNSAEARFKVA